MSTDNDRNRQLREQVRARYAQAARSVTAGSADPWAGVTAGCCAPADHDTRHPIGEHTGHTGERADGAGGCGESCCGGGGSVAVDEAFGAGWYGSVEQGEVPAEALAASLGCGNPTAVAELREGDRVLDLGSGGGIDVLLSARRVGPTGFAYGVDMTEEMLDLAQANQTSAGVTNVTFLKGTIEDVPLPDGAVDVVISNCVVNLSTDKPAVLAEMFRVLSPGGRLGISDVVAEDHLTPADRAERGSYVGCIAGALSSGEYLAGLAEVGFTHATVEFTHDAAPGMHSAIIRATKPTGTPNITPNITPNLTPNLTPRITSTA